MRDAGPPTLDAESLVPCFVTKASKVQNETFSAT